MKLIVKSILLLFLVLPLTGSLAGLELEERRKQVFTQYEAAVVKVIGALKIKDEESQKESSGIIIGTGFFISNEGLVMTSALITSEAERVWIEHKGKSYAARSVGHDLRTGISIIKTIKLPEAFNYVSIDKNAELPEVCTTVMAIGCKLDLDPAPCIGIVCSHQREVSRIPLPTTYLRTDIPSDGGDIGSPVFDMTGQFIGMVKESLPQIRSSFIVPSRAILRIRDDLVFSGHPHYGYLGIDIDPVCIEPEKEHLVISKVFPDGPGDTIGIREGDELVELNGIKLKRLGDLNHAVFFARPGQYLPVKLMRRDNELDLSIRVAERPSDDKIIESVHNSESYVSHEEGLTEGKDKNSRTAALK